METMRTLRTGVGVPGVDGSGSGDCEEEGKNMVGPRATGRASAPVGGGRFVRPDAVVKRNGVCGALLSFQCTLLLTGSVGFCVGRCGLKCGIGPAAVAHDRKETNESAQKKKNSNRILLTKLEQNSVSLKWKHHAARIDQEGRS
jgi:hypothetical protein